ncbi:MAG TPA: serine/threonine-protein kinase, partial [Acidimicrobiales bacterium]
MIRPGSTLGGYTLVRSVGTGGMGEVWAATAGDGTDVAVKVLPEGSLRDANARARFAREVAAAQRVQHPRVQAVLGADAGAERPWLATELVVGPTLAQRVAADGPVTGPSLHALATGLADALAAVHGAGVLHRDVSPANVVLGPDGPVLVDFGIARFAEATTLTMTGTIMGTAGWLAPELLRDDEVTAAADIWSWGAVLAFAATGRPPADGSRAEVVLRKVLDGDLDVRGLPSWLDRIVRRCLDPDPTRRPTAHDLVTDLDPRRALTDAATAPLAATASAPVDAARTTALPARPAPVPKEKVDWVPLALKAAVVGVGALLGWLAPPLVVMIVIAVAVVLAIVVRVWTEDRAEEKHLPVGPGTIVVAAAVAAITALAQVI